MKKLLLLQVLAVALLALGVAVPVLNASTQARPPITTKDRRPFLVSRNTRPAQATPRRPDSVWLDDIDMTSGVDGWAVGSQGAILHWDGSAWTQVASPTQLTLAAVDAVSPDDAWALYPGPSFYDGLLFHWDGSTWSQPIGLGYALKDISMVSPVSGWVISEMDRNGWSRIYFWNGTQWSTQFTIQDGFSAIAMASTTDGWAPPYHWDGNQWSYIAGTPGAADIDMISSDDGWLVTGSGLIYRWNGSAWSPVSSPNTEGLKSISMSSATEGWAVGASEILHCDGSTWSMVTGPPGWFYFTGIEVGTSKYFKRLLSSKKFSSS